MSNSNPLAPNQNPSKYNKYVFKISETKRYRFPTHTNELVVDRSEADTSEVFVTVLEPGEMSPLHKHDDTEQVFHIIEGAGLLTIGKEGTVFSLACGDVVRIPVGVFHKTESTGGAALRYLVVDCFPGGRPGAEPTWDEHAKVLCQQQGWKFEDAVA